MRLFASLLLIVSFVSQASSEWQSTYFNVEVQGQGKPVLLVPGFLCDQTVWDEVSQSLSQQYQVHRISIAGFGDTPQTGEPSLSGVKQDIARYIAHHKLDRPALIGHSLGGFMGFWLASTESVNLGAVVSVDGLPFIGPLFSQNPAVTATDLQPQAEQIKQFYASMNAQGMAASTAQGINRQTTNESARQHIIAMAQASDPGTAADAIYTLMTTDLRQPLANTTTPILLLGASGGFSDARTQAVVEGMYNRQLANAAHKQVAMNTQSRHFIMYDQPQWLTDNLQTFLSETL